jgi:hypothetical protein
MSRKRSALPVALLAGLLVLTTAGTAAADVWGGRDPVGDPHDWIHSPDPEPCGTSTEVAHPEATGVDITRLGVKHNMRSIKLKLTFVDLDESEDFSSSVHLRTPDKDWFVEVDRWDGETHVFLAREPNWDKILQHAGECGSVSVLIGEKYCDRLSGSIDPVLDTVRVVISRACLGSPDWVRAAADAVAFRPDGSSPSDRWAPEGTEPVGAVGPFGPRVRTRPAQGGPVARVSPGRKQSALGDRRAKLVGGELGTVRRLVPVEATSLGERTGVHRVEAELVQ